MNQVVAALPALEYSLRIIKGPHQGQVYKISSPQVSIGRGSENNLSLNNDKKCSRKHALISIANDGSIQIQDVSERNRISVNGQEVKSSALRNGSIIQIGDSEISLHIKIRASALAKPSRTPARPGAPRAKKKSSSELNPARIFLILFLLGFFGLILLSDPQQEEAPIDIRSPEDIEAEIQAARELKAKAQEQRVRSKATGDRLTQQEAQANYVKGFRDYQAGQYERSIKAFQACLALNPDHVLCQRYLLLSRRKFNELIQYNVVLGRRYRDQGQFAACTAAFRNVMAMVKDQNSDIYREAKANFDACQIHLQERF